LKNTNEEINEIATVVRTAIRNASCAIEGLACAKSVRKRCAWRKDLRSCKAKLDRASYNLMLALSSGEATGWIAEDAGKTLEHAGKYIDLLSA
jgi:hypothetical protein